MHEKIKAKEGKNKTKKLNAANLRPRLLLLDQSTLSETVAAAADRGCNLMSRCDPKVFVFFCLTYFSLPIVFFLFQTKEQQEQVLNQSNKVFLYCAFLDYRWACLHEVFIVDSLLLKP